MSLLQIQPFSINSSATYSFANLTVTGNISSGNANLGNLATATYFHGVFDSTSGAQGNITSLGTLSGLTAGGIINLTTASNVSLGTVANVHLTGGSSGQYLQTDGTGNLSWVTLSAGASIANGTSNVSVLNNGNVDISVAGNANVLVITGTGVNVAGTFNTTGNANVGNLGTGGLIIATGNVTGGNLLTGGQVAATGNIVGGNIKSNGAITGVDLLLSGNLTVNGTTTYVNSTTTAIEDPLIYQGGGANNATLTSDDGYDRGFILNYYSGSAKEAFIGWKNSNSEIEFGSNVSVSSGVVTINNFANIRAGSANLGNTVTSNYFIGSGNNLSNIQGGNVSGQVSNALVAGTVYTGAQPNITSAANLTSVGTLTSLTVTANANVGNLNATSAVVASTLTSNVATGTAPLTVTSTTRVANLNVDRANVSDYGAVTAQTSGLFYPVFVSGNTTGNYVLASNAALSFDAGTGILTTGTISAGGGSGGNITGANLVSANYFTGTLTTGAQPNITSVGTLTSLVVTGNITSGNANLGNLVTSNYFAGVLTTAAQPNITSVGTLASLTVTANITSGNANLANLATANFFSGAGNNLSNIQGSNVTGNVTSAITANFANFAGNVTVASQGNITSVGILAGVTVTGVANFTGASNVALGAVGNVKITGGGASQYLQTDGTGNLSWATISTSFSTISNGTSNVSIPASGGNVDISVNGNANILVVTGTGVNVSGTLNSTGNITGANANLGNVVTANYTNAVLTTGAQPNITSTGTLTSLTVTANITGGNANLGNLATANFFSGNGSALSSITGGNVTGQVGNALVASTVYTNAQPNITSVGTLSGLVVTGDTTVTGNLIVTGNTTYINSNISLVEDPVITLGGGANGAALTTNDSKDRGTLLHYYTTQAIDSFMGWKNGAGEFVFASNANLNASTGVVTINNYGNIHSGNANLGNLATANFFSGNGSSLSSITGGNVTGQVGNALVASTVYTNAQPNITSVGTLTSLSVAGTLSLNAIGNLYVPGGSAGYYVKTDGQGNLSFIAPPGSGNANISGSNTQIFFNNSNSNTLGASANLTFNNSTNTLSTTNLAVSGTTNLGAIGNLTITGGSSNQYMRTDGSGSLTWVSLPSTTVNVDAFTGDGTTTAFTLTATPTSVNYTIVAVGGVFQPRSAYTISGTTITFSSAPYNNAVVEVTTILSGVSVSSGGGGGGSYTYSGISANTTLAKGTRYIVNTSSANLTLTLPTNASSTLGDEIGVIDGTGTAATHAITLTVSGGGNIMGGSGDMVVNTNRAAFTLVYYNATQGWILTNV